MPTITGTTGNDTLVAGGSGDTLTGLDGDDILTGGAGNDLLDGGAGNDSLTAGDGTDSLIGGLGNDTMNGGGGFDYVYYTTATAGVSVSLAGGSASGAQGSDLLSGLEGVFGSSSADSITGDGNNNYIEGLLGDDTLNGGGGFDTLSYFNVPTGPSNTTGVVVDLVSGTASGGGGNDVFTGFEAVAGSNLADFIQGGAAADMLWGYEGGDTLSGLDGDDTLDGGNGNDSILAGAGQDLVVGGLGNDTLDGGTHDPDLGSDWVVYSSATGPVFVNLAAGSASGADGNDVLSGFERARGGAFADILTGSAGDDILRGNGGDDTISGGGGFDMADYAGATGGVTVNLAGHTSSGADGIDSLSGIEGVRGSDLADRLTGDSGNNTLRGNRGNDTLEGGSGSDTAEYYNATAGVLVDLSLQQASGGDGNDVLNSIEYASGSFSFADTLIGSSGSNWLNGQGGDDSLSGGAGQDTLIGRAGNDTLDGGQVTDHVNYTDLNMVFYTTARTGVFVDLRGITGDGSTGSGVAADGEGGNDVLMNINWVIASSYSDQIFGSAAAIFEQFEPGLGDDTLDGGSISSASGNRVTYQNASGAVNVDLSAGSASGADGNDILVNINHVRGSGSADVLTGSNATLYSETFDGRAGNDTIDGRGGSDTVRFEAATTGVVVNLALGTAQDGTGGVDVLLNIESVRGSSFNDTLTGSEVANRLEGQAGDDSLSGGAGEDTLLGAGGNDTLDGGLTVALTDTSAKSNEYDQARYDDATSAVSVALGSDGQNGTASGGGVGTDTLIDIEFVVGSNFNDTIYGSDRAVNEKLRGGQGDDMLVAGTGTGVDAGFNFAEYGSASGAVTVNLATQRASGADGNDTLVGFQGILSGAGNDSLTGDAGNNFIDGGAGDDTIDGGDGFDRANYSGASSGVVIDLLSGSVAGPLGNDVLVSIEALRGSEFGDSLLGDNASNDIQARAGNDTVGGGAGQDTLYGGLGDDVLDGGSNDAVLGYDWAYYTAASGGVTVNLATGLATGAEGNDTLQGIEAVVGGAFADGLVGDGGRNALNGGAGNDTLTGGAGSDTFLLAPGSNDVITDFVAGPGGDVLDSAVALTAALLGYAGGNPFGQAYMRVVQSGADTLLQWDQDAAGSAAGFETVATLPGVTAGHLTAANFGGGWDPFGTGGILTGTSGADSLPGSIGADTLLGADGDDSLTGAGGDDSLSGGAGNDTYVINVTVSGGTVTAADGVDVIVNGDGSGAGFDRVVFSSVSVDYIYGTVPSGGLDFLLSIQPVIWLGDAPVQAPVGSLLLKDFFSGNPGDLIDRFDFSDAYVLATLNGAVIQLAVYGLDNLVQERIYFGSAAGDQITGTSLDERFSPAGGNDSIDGGAGVDTVDYRSFSTAGIAVDLSLASGQVVFDGLGGTDSLTSIERVIGSGFGDTLAGGAGADQLLGAAGDDVLDGREGDDALSGGSGSDTLSGGAGIDTAVFWDANDGVTASLASGLASSGSLGNDLLSGFEALSGGNYNDALAGDGNGNDLAGNAGNDTLEGAAGVDILHGGAGADSLSGGDDGDTLYGYQDNSGLDPLFEDGADVIDGGYGNDVLRGNSGSDTLLGGEGNDNLRGDAGNDLIDGGAGRDGAAYRFDEFSGPINFNASAVGTGSGDVLLADQLGGTDTLRGIEFVIVSGSLQADTLVGGAGGDQIQGNSGNDSVSSGDGDDFFVTGGGGNDTVDGGAGNDELHGDSGNDVVLGGAGDDSVSGGSGADTVSGGSGIDSFGAVTGATDIVTDFQAGAGGDVMVLESALSNFSGGNPFTTGHMRLTASGADTWLQVDPDGPAGAGAFQTVLVLQGVSLAALTAANFAPGVNPAAAVSLLGSAGNDALNGTGEADTLSGAGGNDTLTGQAGNDLLDGGSGDDSVSGGAGNDTLLSGPGNDTYQGDDGEDTLSFATAPAGVVVVKPATASMVVMGTASDGSGGSDVFGHGTADKLMGSPFNDTLTGSPVYTAVWNEVFGRDVIDAGAGNDLVMGLSGDDQLTGGSGNDTVLGGDGIDELDGGEGNDFVDGGAGDDLLLGGAGDDTIDGGEGFNIVLFTDASGPVNVSLDAGTASGWGQDVLMHVQGLGGSPFDDTLAGSPADETIAGFGGNDSLNGGNGFDMLYYGDSPAAVTVRLAAGTSSGGEGADSFVHFEGIGGSNFGDILDGDAGANQLLGNGGDDSFSGGQGDDTLDGGLGFDTALFSGNRADYTVSYDGGTGEVTVTDAVPGRDGVDVLVGVEKMQFADTQVRLALVKVDPAGTYLSVASGDAAHAATSILLADYGLVPGDVVALTRLGDYQAGTTGFTDASRSMVAVFSSGSGMLAPPVYLGTSTPRQGLTNLATDISQDFSVNGPGITRVQIPAGADRLLVGPSDSYFSDNTDPDGDYAILIQRLDASTSVAGDDALFGTAGHDTLSGGTGSDILVGGPGNDNLDGGVITDRINYLDLNTVSYAGSTSGINLNLSGITGDGSTGSGTVSDGLGGTDTVSNVDFITGSPFADTIVGSSALIFEQFEGGRGDDTIDGGAIDPVTQANANRANYSNATAAVGADLAGGVAWGADGNDTLININHLRGSSFADVFYGSDTTTVTEQFEGRAGNDTIDGRGGIDLVRYDSATTGVNVNLATGVAQDGLGGTDAIGGIEGIRGSGFNDVLTGGNQANGFAATDGFEFFLGNAGDDTINGGAGYDRVDYTTSTSGVVVTLGVDDIGTASDGLGGTDTLYDIEAVRGSAFADELTGSQSDGLQSFEGREGDDTIDGGDGTDRADYVSSIGAVDVDLAAGTACDGYGSTDTLRNIEDVRGSAWADHLAGTDGANRLDGGAGDDTLVGLDGRDTLAGGLGDDYLDGGASTGDPDGDWVSYFSATGAVTVDLSGMSASGADGSDTLAGIEAVSGSSHADTLRGDAGANVLRGNAGDDTLDGGDGVDWADYGGASASVTVQVGGSASGGDGNDILLNIENLRGSAHDDLLLGDTGANVLRGGAGNDTLDGGLGIDAADFLDAPDAVQVDLEAQMAWGWDGIDTLISIDDAYGSDGWNDTLIGSTGNNYLVGRGGNDLLLGAGDSDTLEGGAGDDTLDGGTGVNTARYNGPVSAYSITAGAMEGEIIVSGPEGTDLLVNIQVLQFADSELAVVFGSSEPDDLSGGATSELIDGGAGDDTLDGGGGSDVLLGGEGDDSLDGGVGSDTMDGGTGTDSMAGGTGDDVYVVDSEGDQVAETAGGTLLVGVIAIGGLGGGIDKVISSINYTLGGFVENLSLAGGAISGTGNDLDNVLVGSASDNTLSGLAGNDSLDGGEGNDTLNGGAGNDTIAGGGGTDVVAYAGARAGYSIAWDAVTQQLVVGSGSEGTDRLAGVELLQFSDGTIDVAQFIDNRPPVPTFSPADDATLVAVNANVVVVFDESVLRGSGAFVLRDGAGAEIERFDAANSTRVTVAGNTLTIDPTAALAYGTDYALEFSAGTVRDLPGNLWSGTSSYNFRTVPNTAPVGQNGTGTTPEDQVLSARLPTATDAQGQAISFERVSQAAHGSVVVSADGGYTYTPAANYHGTDSFSYRVVDTLGAANEYTVSLSVTAVNDVPTGAVSVTGTVRQGETLSASQTLADADGMGTITWQWKAGGTVIAGAVGTSYVPVAADVGKQLTVTASYIDGDGTAESRTSAATAVVAGLGEVFTGTDGPDPMSGGSGYDTVNALAGNDTVSAGLGNDQIDAGAGVDQISFTGTRAQYNLSKSAGVVSAADKTAARDGTDSISNAEILRFSDRSVDLGAGARAATIPAATLKTLEELYVGFFNRIPEASGLGYWIDQIKAGVSLASIANQFYDAGVVFGNYPSSMTNAQFIREIYKNVLGRPPGVPPTDAEVGYWEDRLVRNIDTKGTMVLQMLSDVHTYFEGITDPTNPNYAFQFVSAHLNNKAAVANWYAVQQGLSLNVQVDNVAFGIQMASLITPTDTSAAIGLVGLTDSFTTV